MQVDDRLLQEIVRYLSLSEYMLSMTKFSEKEINIGDVFYNKKCKTYKIPLDTGIYSCICLNLAINHDNKMFSCNIQKNSIGFLNDEIMYEKLKGINLSMILTELKDYKLKEMN